MSEFFREKKNMTRKEGGGGFGQKMIFHEEARRWVENKCFFMIE